jgi:leucine dehydrogenase
VRTISSSPATSGQNGRTPGKQDKRNYTFRSFPGFSRGIFQSRKGPSNKALKKHNQVETMAANISCIPVLRERDDHLDGGIFDQALSVGLEEIHFRIDPISGLKAIIAIHSTSRGPALGGTRCLTYPSESHAVLDAMRLAQSMSYKSAFADLPYGGGKAVLIRPKTIASRDAYFECYGDFIDSLKGRYITAVDVGTTVDDMDIIGRRTRHVLSTSAGSGDPSFHTAQGVLCGILAAVKVCLQRDKLEAVRVAIQGVGKVGYSLASLLHQQGAELAVSDIDDEAVRRCVEKFGAEPVDAEKMIDCDCDVFSPCALGSVINAETVNRIQANIICGAANNQLADDSYGDVLYRNDIFYVPDYVVNAGGLIHVIYGSSVETETRIGSICDSVADIYRRSKALQEPCHRVANHIAEQILSASNRVASDV